jgi:hypothetical protein
MNYKKNFQYERNRKIYILRCKGHTFKEVGEMCGLSTERTRQIVGSFQRKLNRKENPKELKDGEKRLLWGLYYILDDIKSIAEK